MVLEVCHLSLSKPFPRYMPWKGRIFGLSIYAVPKFPNPTHDHPFSGSRVDNSVQAARLAGRGTDRYDEANSHFSLLYERAYRWAIITYLTLWSQKVHLNYIKMEFVPLRKHYSNSMIKVNLLISWMEILLFVVWIRICKYCCVGIILSSLSLRKWNIFISS